MRSALIGWLLLSCADSDDGDDSNTDDTAVIVPPSPFRPLPGRRVEVPDRADAVYTGGPGAGFRVAGLGDLDGDGAEEVGVAEIYTTVEGAVGAGRVRILFGDPGGDPVPGPAWTGGEALEWLGSDALDAGDVDGDGDAELLFGGFGFYLPEDPLRGGPAAVLELRFPGNEAALLADVDGDGRDDVVAQRGTEQAAEVAVWRGPPAPGREADFVVTGSLEGRFGAVLAAGDLDGDGADEVAAGAPLLGEAQQGAVSVYDGQGLLGGPPLAVVDGTARQRVGTGVSIPGDIDGDGRSDLLVGAYAHDGEGGCSAVNQPIVGALFTGLSPRSTLAESAARFVWTGPGCARLGDPVGDLDGDGLAEIPFVADDTAFVFLGAPSGGAPLHRADLRVEGPVGCCSLGSADVDGDGDGDLILGRVPQEDAYERPGEVWLLLGPL